MGRAINLYDTTLREQSGACNMNLSVLAKMFDEKKPSRNERMGLLTVYRSIKKSTYARATAMTLRIWPRERQKSHQIILSLTISDALGNASTRSTFGSVFNSSMIPCQ